MAELDEFFNKAINIARDLGKARTARKQEQQTISNQAITRGLNLEERRVATGERSQVDRANLGQAQLDLDKSALKVRKELGLKNIAVSGRNAGVAERGATLDERSFRRSSDLFNRFFPDPDEESAGGGSVGPSFRNQSDQGVLNAAQSLLNSDRSSALRNPKIGAVVGGARRRRSVANTLEQDLLNLR